MNNWIARAVCLALLSGQTLLPSIHELRAAQQEAGHHLEQNAGPLKLTQADPHDHHDAHSCRVCIGVAQARLECPALPSAAVSLPCFSVALCAPSIVVSSPLLVSAAPRGPPQA